MHGYFSTTTGYRAGARRRKIYSTATVKRVDTQSQAQSFLDAAHVASLATPWGVADVRNRLEQTLWDGIHAVMAALL
jgi:hypothetical protein